PGPAAEAAEAAERIAREVLCDPIVEEYSILAGEEAPASPEGFDHRIDVAKRAGVMDPAADGVLRAVRATGLGIEGVRTYAAWLVTGRVDRAALLAAASRALGNEAIEEIRVDRPPVVRAGTPATAAAFRRIEVP